MRKLPIGLIGLIVGCILGASAVSTAKNSNITMVQAISHCTPQSVIGCIEMFGTTGSAKLSVDDNAGQAEFKLPSTTGTHYLATVDQVQAMIAAALPNPTPVPTPTPTVTPTPAPTPTPPAGYTITGTCFLYEGSLMTFTSVQLLDVNHVLLSQIQTQSNAVFTFSLATGRTYYVRVNQPGYLTAPSEIKVINASGANISGLTFRAGPSSWFCTLNNCAVQTIP